MLSNILKNKKTKMLIIVSFSEFWEMVSFFGTVSVIVLYMTGPIDFTEIVSLEIYGIYLALLCSLTVVGGWISDKLIGNLHAFKIGAILLIIGNVLLFIKSPYFLYSGLSLTICGTSFYKTTCTTLAGQVFQGNINEKDKAYTYFYSILNVGAILGPLIYGLVAYYFGWNYCFLIGAFGILVSLLVFLMSQRDFILLYSQNKTKNLCYSENHLYAYLIIIAMFIFTVMCFILNKYFDIIAILIFIVVFLNVIYICKDESEKIRSVLFAIVILFLFSMLFFTASLQVGSSITLFINKFVDKDVMGVQVPTTFFTALDPFFVIAGAPVFIFIWRYVKKHPDTTLKIAYGLLIGGVGCIFFWLSVILVSHKEHYYILFSLVLGYILIGAGEICFTPAVLSTISNCVPKNLINTIMGLWYFFMGTAGYIGSIIDRVVNKYNSYLQTGASGINLNLMSFSSIFISMAILTILGGVILLICSKQIQKYLSKYDDSTVDV